MRARRRQAEAGRQRADETVQAHSAAGKLAARALDAVHRAQQQPSAGPDPDSSRLLVFVGVHARSAWNGANYDHVPLAVAQLRELGLDAQALPVCAPLHPLVQRYTSAAWQAAYRQCIVIRL